VLEYAGPADGLSHHTALFQRLAQCSGFGGFSPLDVTLGENPVSRTSPGGHEKDLRLRFVKPNNDGTTLLDQRHERSDMLRSLDEVIG
jgi:hypothetical protein